MSILLWLNNNIKNDILEIKGERIDLLKSKIDKKTSMLILQVYAPTAKTEEADIHKLLHDN